MEMNYASNGKANAGLTTGIIGSALGALNSGMFSGILGGNVNNCCESNQPINRYEATMISELSAKDQKIALLESNIYTDSKIADVYERLNSKIDGINAQICQQAVYNATVTSTIGCIQSQIAQLQGLTKLVVPNASVCPGWGNVTVTPATTAATA